MRWDLTIGANLRLSSFFSLSFSLIFRNLALLLESLKAAYFIVSKHLSPIRSVSLILKTWSAFFFTVCIWIILFFYSAISLRRSSSFFSYLWAICWKSTWMDSNIWKASVSSWISELDMLDFWWLWKIYRIFESNFASRKLKMSEERSFSLIFLISLTNFSSFR